MQNFSKKPEKIKKMFNSIAKDYDKLNNLMTFGIHSNIKNSVLNKIKNKKCTKILDLCTGTGDLAIMLKKMYPNAEVTGVDFSKKMLEVAKSRSENEFRLINNKNVMLNLFQHLGNARLCGPETSSGRHTASNDKIKFMEADCTNLPFENEVFDVCVISFGLRNIENFESVISEIHRVLKSDGVFVNIDLGKPNRFFNLFLKPYMYIWVAILGKIFHGDETPYKYLAESNETFPAPEELGEIYKKYGFSNVKNFNYLFGQISAQISTKQENS